MAKIDLPGVPLGCQCCKDLINRYVLKHGKWSLRIWHHAQNMVNWVLWALPYIPGSSSPLRLSFTFAFIIHLLSLDVPKGLADYGFAFFGHRGGCASARLITAWKSSFFVTFNSADSNEYHQDDKYGTHRSHVDLWPVMLHSLQRSCGRRQ